MPIRLDIFLKKIERMSNRVNSDLLKDFCQHTKDNSTSQKLSERDLMAMAHFVKHIGATTSSHDVDHKQVIRFLDKK